MRNATRLLLCALSLAITAAAAGGQVPTGKKAYPLGLESLLDGISLNPKQRAQIDSVADVYWAKMNALRPLLDVAPMEERRKAAQEQRTHLVADIEKLLTKEQAAVFRKNADATRHPPS